MSLRKKTLLIIGITLIGLIALLYASSRNILLQSYLHLETDTARRSVRRGVLAVAGELEELERIAGEWLAASAAPALAANPAPDGPAAAIGEATFAAFRLNAIALLNAAGELVYGQGYDLTTRRPVSLPPGLADRLQAGDAPIRRASAGDTLSGVLALPDDLMLVAAVPLVDGEAGDSAPGTLVVGRLLDQAEVQRLGDAAQLLLSLHAYDAAPLAADLQIARARLSAEEPSVIRPLDGQSLAGYALLDGLDGRPAAILRITMSRYIYDQGRGSMLYFMLALLASGVVFGCMTLLLLEQAVLARLAQLNRSVRRIGVSSDPSTRVTLRGTDELAQLAGAVNGMLDALEQSQKTVREAQNRLLLTTRLSTAGQIAAGVAHQINNPLTTILVESHLLLQGMDPQDPDRESIQAVQEAANRAAAVVRRLLDVARAHPYEMVPLDVNASLQSAIAVVRARVGPRPARVETALAPDLPPVVGSPLHLEDVWLQLLLNARDAISLQDDGVIRVTTRLSSAGDAVQVMVEDNGPGIAPGDLARVFEPFFTTKELGTGLGLSICQEVIAHHSGRIEVESVAGRGATFTVLLPVGGRGA